MKPSRFSLPEFFHYLSFLLYLGGSSYAQAQNGIELSLWLMALAVVISAMTTILPWLGFRWLGMPVQGSRFGKGISLVIQIGSWISYAAAMFFRLTRNLPRFHALITVTTLLWAGWFLLFINSRQISSSDMLSPATQSKQTGEEKVEK